VSHTIDYLYCVVPSGASLTDAPPGLDASPVRTVALETFTAVTSQLDAAMYTGEAMTSLVGDVAWVTPRAMAHDRVVTWVSDRVDAVIPMPMWTLYSGDAALRDALGQQAPTLASTLAHVAGAREYSVRLFARRDAVAASLGALSEEIAALHHAVEAASPGQAYLLSRKLAAATTTEVRQVAIRVGDELVAALSPHARATVRESLPKPEGDGFAVVNAAFLVQHAEFDAFRSALSAFIARYEPLGFRCEFTGPWPPYHFVRDR